MNDTYSPMSPLPLAFYDPDSSVWRTSTDICLWGDQPSLERLPDWGTTRGGELYELPTPVRLTAARAYSSLLATPRATRGGSSTENTYKLLPTSRATDGDKGGPNQVNGRGVRDSLPGLAPTLLPTPLVNAATGAGHQGRDGGANLQTAVSLLPTPAVNDMGRGKTPEDWDAWTDRMRTAHGNGNGHGKSLEIEAQRLMPTPTSTDHKSSSGSNPDWGHGTTLTDAARSLAPTPQPSPDGNTSQDATLPLPLNLDATGDPA